MDEPGDSAVWRRGPLLDQALRRRTTAVQLFSMSRCANGKRRDREHDSTGDQSSAQGQRHLLDGGECGSRVPVAGCRHFRSVGRDPGAHAREAIARDRRTEWHWTPLECLADLKASMRRTRNWRKHQRRHNLEDLPHNPSIAPQLTRAIEFRIRVFLTHMLHPVVLE